MNRSGATSTPRFSPALFAGVNLKALTRAPSEKPFYDALGVLVLAICCGSGAGVCVAVSYVLVVPANRIWWIVIVWGLFMVCIERVVLQMPSRSSGWLLIGLVWRVLLSLIVAVGMEPLILLANHREIGNYLRTKVTNELRAAHSATTEYFVPKIEGHQRQITALRAHEDELKHEVEHWHFLSACEAHATACSTTHRTGRGPFWEHYAEEAATAESELRIAESEDRARIAHVEEEIRGLQEAERVQETSQRTAITEDTGLPARMEALGAIESRHPVVEAQVWFLRVAFVVIDLIPLGAKIWRMFAVKPAPYEEACAAERRHDALGAKQQDADASVEEKRIDEQACADINVNRVCINVDAERRMDEAYAAAGRSPEAPPASGETAEPTIQAWSLATFAQNMTRHETRSVTVPPALRRGGLFGLAAVAVLGVLMQLWGSLTGHALAGIWLVWTCLGAFAALAAYTRGFASAPAWALRAMFGGLLLGLTLPILIIAVNL